MIRPDQARWQMLAYGAWRPVTYMGQGETEVKDPMRATVAVVYLGPSKWLVVVCQPGDIIPLDGAPREWEAIN